MAKALQSRVGDLETKAGVGGSARAVAALSARIGRIAASFPETDAALTEEERLERMSPAEHCAWLLRFRGEADLPAVLRLHGRSGALPRDAIESVHVEMNILDLAL